MDRTGKREGGREGEGKRIEKKRRKEMEEGEKERRIHCHTLPLVSRVPQVSLVRMVGRTYHPHLSIPH